MFYYRGRNIADTYILKTEYVKSFNFNKYVNYWKKHRELLHKGNPAYGVEIFEKLYLDGLIKEEKYRKVEAFLKDKRNPITVVPEIVVEKHWKYEDIAANGEKWLVNEIINALNNTLDAFD